MQSPHTLPTQQPALQLPVTLVAEVQDALLVAAHDLARLDRLLAQSMDKLMDRFSTASAQLADPALPDAPALEGIRTALRAAMTELQCQDLAAQLIGHTSALLQGCAYRLASEAMGPEDGEAVPFVAAVPERPNPVTQGEREGGSIELF